MHGSFILFTKRELKTRVLLRTSLEVTSLLGMTVSLAGVTDLKASFLRSLAPGAYIEGTCARGAYTKGTYYGSICTETTSTEGAYTKSFCAMGTCTKGAYIKGAYLRGVGTRDTCTGDTYARGACIQDIGPEGTGTKSACTRSAGVVEHSRIHSQSFLISEVRGAGLKI